MTDNWQRYAPPPPVYQPAPAAPEAPPRQRRWTLASILIAAASIVVVAGLALAVVLLWNTRAEVGPGMPADRAAAADGPPPSSAPAPTATPHQVVPGESISIRQDAVFPNGVTLTGPAQGDWTPQRITNRPDQLTLMSPDFDAQIQVWQTQVFGSNRTDYDLTLAALNRIGDECLGGLVGQVSPPDSYWLTGTDGTRLELLRSRATGCEGGEVWLLERQMPGSRTRFHIVVWGQDGVENSPELLRKLGEVAFTTP